MAAQVEALVPVEQALVAYIEAGTSFSASTRVPNPRPSQFVTVVRNGGVVVGWSLAQPVVRVECWGGSDSQAWAVVSAVWPLVAGMADVPEADVPRMFVNAVEVTEPVNFPDQTGTPRYQFLATLTVTPKE